MEKRNAWEHREKMESRMSRMETHVENIYHHVKRIESHLDKQNGRIRDNEFALSKWKGVAIGIIAVSTAISSLVTMAMK